MKIKASASGKLLLFGDHAVIYNCPCLAAAINQKMTVTIIEKRGKESVFVKATRDLFERKHGGVSNGFKIDGFSSNYGLGSSAAVTVALAKALFKLKQIKISQKELFDFCYQAVKQVQGVGSGFDVAASVYGGIIYFVTGGKKIEKLPIKELPIVVGYSGVKADTATMIKKVAKKINQEFLEQSTKIVNQARIEMEQKNWPELGKLMNQNQEILKKLTVSTPKLARMIRASLKVGAWGAKLSGAGGGDCMIALHRDGMQGKLLVERAIKKAGGKVLRVKLAL